MASVTDIKAVAYDVCGRAVTVSSASKAKVIRLSSYDLFSATLKRLGKMIFYVAIWLYQSFVVCDWTNMFSFWIYIEIWWIEVSLNLYISLYIYY